MAATFLFSMLIGVIAGLRAMTAPAAVSWAASLGWLPLEAHESCVLGYRFTPWILTVCALGEFVTDQLPTTPSRTVPVQFGARIVVGRCRGAAIGAASGRLALGAVAGVIGAVIGTLGGGRLRGASREGVRQRSPGRVRRGRHRHRRGLADHGGGSDHDALRCHHHRRRAGRTVAGSTLWPDGHDRGVRRTPTCSAAPASTPAACRPRRCGQRLCRTSRLPRADFGIDLSGAPRIDIAAVKARADPSRSTRAPASSESLRELKTAPSSTRRRVRDADTVRVGSDLLSAPRIFINVGGRANVPRMPGIDSRPLPHQHDHPGARSCPRHLVVVGGSYIGLEFAADVPPLRRRGHRSSKCRRA
jgi:uncharacterized membrane protein